MIPSEKLLQVTDVFFHQNCPDGSASAAVLARAFKILGTSPRFRSLQYGTRLMDSLEPRPGQLFVDITPPMARWREWEAVGPVVLDHHETAREAVEGLGGVYRTNDSHSGTVIALEEVLEPLAGSLPPEARAAWIHFATVAMVRDTWKKDSPLWDEACAQAEALNLLGADEMVLRASGPDPDAATQGLDQVGRLLLGRSRRKTGFCADRAERFEALVRGRQVRGAVFNCTEKLTSDIANQLIAGGANVAAGYFYTFEDGVSKTCVSLRTDGTVSARGLAEAFGGGGHERAAGFNVPEEAPSAIVGRIKSALWRASRE